MDKWRLRLDLAHQLGLETILTRFLIVERGPTGGEDMWGNFSQSPSDFEDVLATTAKTHRAMDKWILWLDLTGQKGLNSASKSLLVIADSCCTTE